MPEISRPSSACCGSPPSGDPKRWPESLPDLAQTMFIPPRLALPDAATVGDRRGRPPSASRPAWRPAVGTGTFRGMAAVGGSRMSTWLAVAAAALAAVALAVALTGRDGGTQRDGDGRHGAHSRFVQAAPPARSLRPAPSTGSSWCLARGRQDSRDGHDAGVTPADVSLADLRGGTVRLRSADTAAPPYARVGHRSKRASC